MPKFEVVAGKHNMRDAKGNMVYVRQGGTLELSKAEAAKFPGKFKSVDESADVSTPESTSGSAVPGGEASTERAGTPGMPEGASSPQDGTPSAATPKNVAPATKATGLVGKK